MILLVISAVAFGLLVLAWLVYPALMWLRGRHALSATVSTPEPRDRVTVVVATRDDPAFAVERVRNLRSSDYPDGLLSIVVAVDVTSPFSLDTYRQALSGLADVVTGDTPGGKATTLNAGVRAVPPETDILVFADVGQEFSRDAITHLVAALRDERLGAVTGRYTHGRGDELMSAYADLEATIRAGQAEGRSVVSATGAILAMRPALWRELPVGLICDDLYTGLSVVRQGSRVGFRPQAIAFDPRVFTQDQQFARRVRTLTGLIQYCMVEPAALVPVRNPVWLHFFMHKVLRLLTPIIFATGCIALMAWLVIQAPVASLIVLAILLLTAVEFRFLAPTRFRRLREQAVWAVRLMFVPVVAIANGLQGRWAVWTPTSQVRDLHGTGA
jgi:cellulose synthase/poly-beta-1,6-N-acetylglucosamine synthase-like glycosyltransferase